MAQFMFLISGTNHMFLVWLLVKIVYCIWFKPRFNMKPCLRKSQNLLQRAYLWVCMYPHEKPAKIKLFFVSNFWWKYRKYALLCIPHTTSEATQKNMGKEITWMYSTVWYSENRAQHSKPCPYFWGVSLQNHTSKAKTEQNILGYLNVIR